MQIAEIIIKKIKKVLDFSAKSGIITMLLNRE